MQSPHSATPAAFQTEAPHEECAGQEVLQTQTRRNWKKKLFLQPPERGEDSDLSSSSGSIVPYVHPTEGKTHLSIKDTEDYLTVQNPNPHTGRMSPAFSSVMMEHHEPIALRGAKDAGQVRQKYEGRAFEDGQRPRDRWPDFWRPLRKASTLKRKPPAPYVEDGIEEPPDALSDVSPLQAQPSPTHFAAFDPDHLRIPGALRVSPPPPKTKTNEGTDAIATWVTTGSRKVYELPAVRPSPPEMELPSVPQHEPSSCHIRFSDDCSVRYPYYSPPVPPVHHQMPTPPHTPQFAKIEIARKPLAHGCEEDAPPVPPKHAYIPKTWSQSTRTRASVVSSRSHPIEHAYQSDTISVEKAPTRLNGNGVPRIVVTTGKKVDQDHAKERGPAKDISKDKEKDKSKVERREKGYRREKELLQAELLKVQNSAEREKGSGKAAGAPDQQDEPKPRSKSKSASTRDPAATKTGETSTTTTADRSATLKAAFERIATAKAKRIVSAPVKAPTIRATAAAATKDPARSKSHTVSAAGTALAGSRPLLPSFTTATAAVDKAAITSAQPATAISSPETTTLPPTEQQTLVSLTITRSNAILVGKVVFALWGLLAAFYLLGALGRALWVVLAPVRLLLRGVGTLGGCVRGAGW